jgi:hypothetical protein
MKKLLLGLAVVTTATLVSAQTVIQRWNFTENGSGIASLTSDQSLGTTFFNNGNTEVAFDGGYTVNRTNGTSGDILLGLSLTDANTSSVTLSVTLASFDFSAGTADTSFAVNLRNDASNTTISALEFRKQDANSRMRLTGTALAGIALNAESSATSIT